METTETTPTQTVDVFAMDQSDFDNFDFTNYTQQPSKDAEETSNEEQIEDLSNPDQRYDEQPTEELISEEKEEREVADTEEFDEPEEGEQLDLDYEAEYKKLIGEPIKANGKDIVIKSPEEARRLMQMGANYYKQMETIKPHRKMIAMLEQNGLMDEQKLNYAIDLLNKNPNAISKLVAEAGDDYSYEDASQYKPTDYSVDSNQLEVTDALKSIRGSETYDRTIKVIGSEWDLQSREIISQHPSVITEINSHIANGMFDQVSAEVERRKLFGMIPENTPSVMAYKMVGDEMFGQGANRQPAIKPPSKSVQEVNTNKRAASKPRGITNNKAENSTPDIMNMSSEEFAKYASKIVR